MSKRAKIYMTIVWVVLAIYVLGILYITLFGSRSSGVIFMLNLKPFRTIGLYMRWLFDGNRSNNYIPIVNLGVNIIMLMPMGYFLPELFDALEDFIPYALVCFAFVMIIEIVQFFTRLGSCDVDDVLLNMLGAVIGYILCRFIHNFVADLKQKKTEK